MHMFNADQRSADKMMPVNALCWTCNDAGRSTRARRSGPREGVGLRGSVMDYAVEEIAPGQWRVQVAGTVRVIRHRPDIKTFAPWDICTEDGRRLWGSPTLESAFRWIQ